jgi:hypothetical protein
MPKLIDLPEHWRARAEESRVLAEQLSDPETRRMMLGIAQSYERLAERAAERLKHENRLR